VKYYSLEDLKKIIHPLKVFGNKNDLKKEFIRGLAHTRVAQINTEFPDDFEVIRRII
jgi:hypothetical protein